MDADDRPPICATCGVTMVPAALSALEDVDGDWVCLECEELDPEAAQPRSSGSIEPFSIVQAASSSRATA